MSLKQSPEHFYTSPSRRGMHMILISQGARCDLTRLSKPSHSTFLMFIMTRDCECVPFIFIYEVDILLFSRSPQYGIFLQFLSDIQSVKLLWIVLKSAYHGMTRTVSEPSSWYMSSLICMAKLIPRFNTPVFESCDRGMP